MNARRPYEVKEHADWTELVGPGLSCPCDLMNEDDPDTFCEMMNDAYEAGFEAAVVISTEAFRRTMVKAMKGEI